MNAGMPAEDLTGRLLVASPSLKDPNFERSVVLLIAHEPSGALGVVLNRATEVQVEDVLDGWHDFAAQPSVVFEGGPVQPEAAICLARVRPGTSPDGFSRVEGVVGTVDLSASPEGFNGSLDRLRVFAGYAGWDADQLETEIEQGAWLVLDALPGDAFVPQPDDLWSMVLRRQGGMLAALAFYPADPQLN
ncbi:YqgE/AlgH family protein [Cryptosporangium sp. NPDC051539]|uniref:YqgE/AlgH family protein n=1 Tax=Cryptosporangium sp. NPDC051539 TaxID=3363962 RepID=UPI0037BCC0D1